MPTGIGNGRLDTEIHQHDSESTATPAIRPLKDEAQEKMNIINALKACNGHREQAASMLKNQSGNAVQER